MNISQYTILNIHTYKDACLCVRTNMKTIGGGMAKKSNSDNSQKKSVPQERREGLSLVTLQDCVDVALRSSKIGCDCRGRSYDLGSCVG